MDIAEQERLRQRRDFWCAEASRERERALAAEREAGELREGVETLTKTLTAAGRCYHAVAHDFVGGHADTFEVCEEYVCRQSRAAVSSRGEAK